MEVKILGNIQDGGLPHMGCECELCQAAREDPCRQKFVSSILLREDSSEDSFRYLIDASPDIRNQISGKYIDGVFIPHHEIGHATGLLFFGEQGIDANGVTVFCNDRVENFLMKNDPYRYLVDRDNIDISQVQDGERKDLQGVDLEVREEHHENLNREVSTYFLEGPEKTLYYVPDIHEWSDSVVGSIREADIAIIDGTFWSRDEIDRYDEVPHPPIEETMGQMEDFETEIYFTHINHTNPVLREGSDERQELEDRGFRIAEQDMELEI